MNPQPSTAFADVAELDMAAPAVRAVLSARQQREVASNILAVVMKYQRVTTDAACVYHPCSRCMDAHRSRVVRFVARSAPVEFALPSFPVKSPNSSKTLGAVPDMAERLSLEFLGMVCDRIRQVYQPGARIVICSDGRVFSDLIQVNDSDVTNYQIGLQKIIDEVESDSLDLFNLDHEYRGSTHTVMRQTLMQRYGGNLAVLKEQVRAGGDQLTLYRGITRFLVEDASTPEYQGSRAALQRECRERAYGVIQRSKAWGDLIAERFPHAVRLSIHPQACGSGKLGIHLLETADNWLTPWHGTAVKVGNRFILMKRHEAETIGARLIYVDGKPSHYVDGKHYVARNPSSCVMRRKS